MTARRILVSLGVASLAVYLVAAVVIAVRGMETESPGPERPDRGLVTRGSPVQESPPTSVLRAARGSRRSPVPSAIVDTSATTEESSRATESELATLEVRVVSSERGEAIGGVRLSLRSAHGDLASASDGPATTVSDCDGRATLRPRAGSDLVLEADGRWVGVSDGAVQVGALAGGTIRTMAVQLATVDSRRYFGRVVDAGTGAPLGEASATLLLGTPVALGVGADEEVLARASCDASGRFSFWVADFGRDLIQVEHAGHGTALLQVTGGHASAATAREVALERASSLVAILVEAGGAPAEGVEVRLRACLRNLARSTESSFFLDGQDRTWSAWTDSLGRATLHGLPPGVELELHLERGGEVLLHESGLALGSGELFELDRRLGGGSTVRGVLPERDGTPAAGVEVWLARAGQPGSARYFRAGERAEITASTTSGPSGRFRFSGVGPGDWWIGPAPVDDARIALDPDRAIAASARRITIEDELDVHDLTLEVHRGLYVRGRVLDPAGDPVAGARVGSYGHGVWTRTEDGGSFRFGPLVPAEHRLFANTLGDSLGLELLAGSEPSTVAAGASDVVLRLRPGALVEGRVVDAASREALGAEVRLVSADPVEAGFHTFYLRTARDGTFRRGGLVPGEYLVVALTPGSLIGLSPPMRIEPGEQRRVILELGPAARLHLALEGPRARTTAFEVRAAGASVNLTELAGGSEVALTVPAGPVRIVHLGTERLTANEADVEARLGEEARVTFRLAD